MSVATDVVDGFRRSGWESNPHETVIRLIDEEPEVLLPLAKAVLESLPRAETLVSDMLSHLSEQDLNQVLAFAFYLDRARGHAGATDEVIVQVALQAPHLLASFHEALLGGFDGLHSHFHNYLWLGATAQTIGHLAKVAEDALTRELRRKAQKCLFESRNLAALELARQRYHRFRETDGVSFEERARKVDFQVIGNNLRALYSVDCHHLIFPTDYFDGGTGTVSELRKRHPTWRVAAGTSLAASIGGKLPRTCKVCGGSLHILLTLPQVPWHSLISLASVSFGTCLSCLGWEKAPLYYRHDDSGNPACMNIVSEQKVPLFPAQPLKYSQVQLSPTPSRWIWQDWGISNHRQNLHRFGGPPCWIQGAEYPNCLQCVAVMPFVAQLDSDLVDEAGREWLWGSGGGCYIFWCDGCRVSALFWQRT